MYLCLVYMVLEFIFRLHVYTKTSTLSTKSHPSPKMNISNHVQFIYICVVSVSLAISIVPETWLALTQVGKYVEPRL